MSPPRASPPPNSSGIAATTEDQFRFIANAAR